MLIDVERSNVIDFTRNFWTDEYAMIMYAVKPFSYLAVEVFLPFSLDLWLTCLGKKEIVN